VTDDPAGRFRRTAAVVVLGSFLIVLDTTVVMTALPRLSGALNAPLASIQWVATAYTLALAAVMPVSAWAVRRVGGRRAYLTPLVLFGAGSLLAGIAWSAGSLIAFRVVQGLGGGMLVPIGSALVIQASGPERMGRAMRMLGLPVLIGPLLGPVLGGALVDSVSWRWIFLINLPVVAAAVVGAWRVLPRAARSEPAAGGSAQQLDLPGLLLLSPGLALLIYGLTAGGAVLPLVAGGVMVAAFPVRALTARQPLLDLRLLARGRFAGAAAAQALFVFAYFGSMLLRPMYFQDLRGTSATGAGLLGIPQVLATGITMQYAGRLVDRHRADGVSPARVHSRAWGRIVLGGVVTAALGFAGFTAQLGAYTPYWRLLAATVLMGVGVGLTMMPSMAAATRGVPEREVPQATTALSVVQQTASAAGTSVLPVLLAHGLRGAGDVAEAAGAYRSACGWGVLAMTAAVLPALALARARER
jgi:EmrB/QacA subfamily drug resistance transporter